MRHRLEISEVESIVLALKKEKERNMGGSELGYIHLCRFTCHFLLVQRITSAKQNDIHLFVVCLFALRLIIIIIACLQWPCEVYKYTVLLTVTYCTSDMIQAIPSKIRRKK